MNHRCESFCLFGCATHLLRYWFEGPAGSFNCAAVVRSLRYTVVCTMVRAGMSRLQFWSLWNFHNSPRQYNKIVHFLFVVYSLLLNIKNLLILFLINQSSSISTSGWFSLGRSKHLKLYLSDFFPARLGSELQVCGIVHSKPHYNLADLITAENNIPEERGRDEGFDSQSGNV